MSSRAAARGKAAANSIRLTSRTSKAVATSRASPSRCFLFCRGSRAARSAPIAVATVAIPPTRKPPQARRSSPITEGSSAPGNLMGGKGSQGWKLKLVRQGPERWQWSGREPSRPKSLDIRRPIQGRLDEGGDVEPLIAVVAEGDRPLTFGHPDPAQDRLQANAVLVRGPDLDR